MRETPSLKLVHSVAEPEITTFDTKRKRARLGVVRNELSYILGKSDDKTKGELSRLTPIARQFAKDAVYSHFKDREAAESVEHIPDLEYSVLENGRLRLCFGFIHAGERKLIGTEVDSKHRIGLFAKGDSSDEDAFTLFDPDEE
jgi:hypothetical protein